MTAGQAARMLAQMDEIDTPSRTTAPVEAPRLSPLVEGVEFWLALPGGKRLRCVITETALQSHFGALEDRPETWLASFERHRQEIEAQAVRASGRRDGVHVVLVNGPEGQLKAWVGRSCA